MASTPQELVQPLPAVLIYIGLTCSLQGDSATECPLDRGRYDRETESLIPGGMFLRKPNPPFLLIIIFLVLKPSVLIQ